MGFYDKLKEQQDKRKTLTENGAVAYETSGTELVDFNFSVSKMRKETDQKIRNEFEKVFLSEDPETVMRYLFYLGDCREGLGERKAFRVCLAYIAENQAKYANAVMKLIPEYNRWDTVLIMLDHKDTEKLAVKIIKEQLKADMKAMKNGESVSLCAKWMPSENASSAVSYLRAKELCKLLRYTPAQYRRILSSLRKYLNVVEVKMSNKEWGEIDYSAVPSKANLKYKTAFMRNDEARRKEFLESLKKGETKINASVLTPDEIVAKYGTYCSPSEYDEAIEQLWKALPVLSTTNNLVVRDGSGSMTCCGGTPIRVSTALAIYMSEHNSGDWKDKFITFSSNPKIIDLSHCKTLRDKLRFVYRYNDYSNTDIYKTMKLILDTAVSNDMPQEEMPELITIISDMQFDGRWFNMNETLFEGIQREYEAKGYKLPRICFWNVAATGLGSNTVPMQQNEYGLILCSGYSPQIMKMFMSNKISPYDVLIEEINKPRYDAVADAIKGI